MELRYLTVKKVIPGLFWGYDEYLDTVLQYKTKKDGEWITVPVVEDAFVQQ